MRIKYCFECAILIREIDLSSAPKISLFVYVCLNIAYIIYMRNKNI